MQTVKLPLPYDQRASGSPNAITNEKHVVGEDNETGWVTLNEAPASAAGVTISGYTRVTGAPAAGEFRVYATSGERLYGKVQFNAADDGDDVQVSYSGLGTPSSAAALRRFRETFRQNAINFLSYQDTVVADYDAMWAAALADITDGDTLWFPGNRTYSFDSVDLGTDGHENMRFLGGAGAVFKKKTTGTFGATNTEHLFYDKASTSDGLTVIGIEIDLSRSSASGGDTVSAFMLVRHDRFAIRHCIIRDGIEEGLKLYKCKDVQVEDVTFDTIRNNGVQCHAPSSDGYTGAKANRGWENIWVFNCRMIDIDDGAGGALDGEGVTLNSTDNAVVCSGAWIYGNYMLRCIRGIHTEANPSGGSACWMDNINIFQNAVVDAMCHGIILGGVRYSNACDNVVRNPGQTGNVTGEARGMVMTGTQGATMQQSLFCTMSRNRVYDDRGGSAQMTYGVYVVVAEDCEVEGNIALGALTSNHYIIETYCKRVTFRPARRWQDAKIKASGWSQTSTGSWQNMEFAAEVWDECGMHSTASNKERVNALIPGVHRVRANVTFTSNSTGWRGIRIEKVNGGGSTVIAEVTCPAVNGDDTSLYIESLVEMTAVTPEWLRVVLYQNSGGNLSVNDRSWCEVEHTGQVQAAA